MANRPVFVSDEKRLVRIAEVEFDFASGFAKSQKQKCIVNLHESYKRWHPEAKLLDISRYSNNELGVALSAFNLTLKTAEGQELPVELAYQAGKVFAQGGPYLDLLDKKPSDAKRDPRLENSGKLIGFQFDGAEISLHPIRLFYTWLYLRGLDNHRDLADQLMAYDAFTDIVFNPNKSTNCQAHAAAVYVSLRKRGDEDKAVKDLAFLSDLLKNK